MRDPNRIDKFCDDLKEVWKQYPDWRFGQLMVNAIGDYMASNKRDVFYLEEPEMMTYLRGYVGLKV